MKRAALSICFFVVVSCHAQVGIGTNSPSSTAVLDLSSSSKGLLVPRLTTAQRTGIGAPATGLLVFDTNANQFYYYNGSAWVQAIGPSGTNGTNGTNGNTILSGTSVPTAGTGVTGDFYLNITTSILYGPKSGGSWPAGISLIGPSGTNGTNGTNGNTILNGTAVPGAGTGVAGDFYIRTSTNQLYGPKTSSWPAPVSLIGATGATGASGVANNFALNYYNASGLTIAQSSSWILGPATQVALAADGALVNATFSIKTQNNNNEPVECSLCWGASAVTGPWYPINISGTDIELTHRLSTIYQVITVTGKLVPTAAGTYWVGPCFKSNSDDLLLKAVTGYGIILD